MGFIIAQISGIIALILVAVSYFVKLKPTFLALQMAADVFYAGSFFAVDAYVGGIITTISIFRCIYIYCAEKTNFKYTVHFLFVFIAMYVVVTIRFWQTPYDIIALITGSMFTLSFAIKNLQVMRYVLIVPNILILIYNILCRTYTSALLDFIELIVLVVSIIKYHRTVKSKTRLKINV